MVTINGITGAARYYENTANRTAKQTSVAAQTNQTVAPTLSTTEEKLSAGAKEYLAALREQYGDFDFAVADSGDDKRAAVDKSNKEFTVIFSSAELERMSRDADYAQQKMHSVQTIVSMSERINQQFGFERGWNQGDATGVSLSKLAVSVNDDGTMTLWAELEKVTEKQKDYIEKLKEKREEEKKEVSVKKTTVEATSEEELIERLKAVEWDKLPGENLGARFDFSV